jgi:hypothetical protein
MLLELTVNDHRSRIASVADLRQRLAPFASQQFREIWVSMDSGGPSLCAYEHKRWLAYVFEARLPSRSGVLRATECAQSERVKMVLQKLIEEGLALVRLFKRQPLYPR